MNRDELLDKLYAILNDDPIARQALAATKKVIDDCDMTPEQADIAYEMCVLACAKRNPKAFRLIADTVWGLQQMF